MNFYTISAHVIRFTGRVKGIGVLENLGWPYDPSIFFSNWHGSVTSIERHVYFIVDTCSLEKQNFTNVLCPNAPFIIINLLRIWYWLPLRLPVPGCWVVGIPDIEIVQSFCSLRITPSFIVPAVLLEYLFPSTKSPITVTWKDANDEDPCSDSVTKLFHAIHQ